MPTDSGASAQQQFSKIAERYRYSSVHAKGDDLRQMVGSVSLSGTEKVLDIATGAGHTALAFAPFVCECYGIDLTAEMVQVATKLAEDRRVSNVRFQAGSAEDIPFPDASFDIATCRFAAHHFANVGKAVREIARVLKPGGIFLLVDHYAPEDATLDAFVNRLDKMRDPSHVREHSLSEWKALFDRHGLSYHEILKWDLPLEFQEWVERSDTPPEVQRSIVELLKTASKPCKETFRVDFDENGYPSSFCLKCALTHGTR